MSFFSTSLISIALGLAAEHNHSEARTFDAPAQAEPSKVAKHAVTIDDILGFAQIGDLVVNPAGTQVAFVVMKQDLTSNKKDRQIWIMDLAGSQKPHQLTTKTASSHSPQWSAQGDAIYFLSDAQGVSQIWRQKLNTNEAVQVSFAPFDIESFAMAPDGRGLAFSVEIGESCETLACEVLRRKQKELGSGFLHKRLFVRHWDTWKRGTMSRLFYVALTPSGLATESVLLSRLDGDVPSKPSGGAQDYRFLPDGRSLVFIARMKGTNESISTNFDLYRVGIDGQELQNLTPENQASDLSPAISPDGRYVAWSAMARAGFENDRMQIMIKDLQSGETRSISANVDRSFAAPQWSKDGRYIYATADDLGQVSLYRGEVNSGKWRKLLGEGSVNQVAVANENLVLLHDDLSHPAEIFTLSAKGGRLQQKTAMNTSAVKKIVWGRAQQFRFEGAKGETVYGYVVKPPFTKAGEKVPVALLIHGGPEGGMGNQFHYRWNAQVFAGAGFAAVMIDFHGSLGYGQAFTDAVRNDWGGAPLEDLQRGLIAAAKTFTFLDLDRACAIGGSYGGFMTNWIAGQWPDGFRCLVNHAGIFDHRSMGYSTEEQWFYEWEHGGPYFAPSSTHEKHNPVSFVDRWRTPMLVIHGEKDFRVPIEQGISAFTALQRRGIASEFLVFPDENHWITKPQNAQRWYATVLGWLGRFTAQTNSPAK